MLIFKNKQHNFNDISLINNNIFEKNINIQTKSERDEYNKMIFYPSSSKEWSNSIYSYNKSYIKSLIGYDSILNKLFKSYSNMLPYKTKSSFKRRRDNKIRYSANRIYTSKAEINHTNISLLAKFFGYNKQKSSLEKDIRKIITLIKLKKNFFEGKTVFVSNYQNRLLHLLKNNFFIFRKWNTAFFKTTGNLLGYLLINVKKRYLKSYNIPTYNIRLLKIFSRLQKILFNSIKLLHINKNKFNVLYTNLIHLGLISLLEKLYNKKVDIDFVELRSIALNSDVFSSAVALKLRERKNKAVSILRKAILQMVRIPDLHTLITFDNNVEVMNKNNIINTMKQQVVSGVRFEAAGRLTRRLTAMRSVFKYRYAGSLKDIRSSFNNESSTILRGYAKSNSQYTLINSKTRNGTFGLKGWISSHTFTIYSFSFMLLSSLILTPIIGSVIKLYHGKNPWKFLVSPTLLEYIGSFMKSVIIIFIFVFIPLSLEWDIVYFCILLLLTLGSIIFLLFTYNSSNIIHYYSVDMLAIFAGFYERLVVITMAHSIFNDVYLFINIIIGLSMIIINLLKSNESISIKKQILFILNNKKFVFIFYLVMFLIILIVNMVLLQIGLGIIVDTNSTTLFFYTYFSKIISIRLIITAVFFYITNKLTLDNVSLSIFSVIFMFLLGSANYYIVMPYVKFVISLGLIKVVNVISYIRLLVEDSAVRVNNTQSLSNGIYNLLKKIPIIGRYLSSFNTNIYDNKKSGPFLLPSNYGVIKNKISIYPLKTISKFTKIGIPSIVNTIELDCSFKGNFSNLRELVNNNTLYFTNLISKLVPKSLNLTCKINLTCGDQVVIINTSFKNGQLENLHLNRNNLEFDNSKVYDKTSNDINFFNFISSKGFSQNLLGWNSGNSMDSFYHPSENIRELLRLTKPEDNKHNLQVFMERDYNSNSYNNYDYNIQQNSQNNGYYNQEAVYSTGELDSNLNDEMVYSNNENIVDWNNVNMENLNSSNVVDWNNINMENWNNVNMEDLNSSNVVDWNNINMENLNDVNMVPYSEAQEINYSIQQSSYNNNNYIPETGYYPENNNLNYYNPNGDYLNQNYLNYNINNANVVPYLETQYMNPYTQEVNPSSKEVNSSTQEVNPSTQEVNPSSQEVNPSSQEVNTSTKEVGSSTQEVDSSSQEVDFCTQEIISYLIEGLKTRMQNLFIERDSRNIPHSRCVFKDIGIVYYNGSIIDKPSYQPTNFSRLLRGISLNEKVWVPTEQIKFQEISTRTFYNKLCSLSENTLTTDQIKFIFDKLSNKVANRVEYMSSNNEFSDDISLSDIDLYCNNQVIVEKGGDLDTCLFTCLLEAFYRENPKTNVGNFSNRSVYVLLDKIKTSLEKRT